MATLVRRIYHPGSAIASIIEVVFGIIQVFLGLRFILKFFGANMAVPLVQWIYNVAGALLAPFYGIFPTVVLGDRFVLEFTTLFAMIVYGLIRWVLIAFTTPRGHDEIVG